MKTTLIAHACLLVESKNTTLISDPVLFDYLWEEINVHCPAIDLKLDKIPPVDILNLSHRHQDHFDIRSLAYLATFQSFVTPETIVLAPDDDILLEMIHELGLPNITVVRDFEPIQVKDFKLIPTPSLNQQDYFPEHGLLISDGDVTVWNQVDTIVSPEIIQHIHNLCGRVDMAHNRFLPLLEGNFSFHQPLQLPFEEYSSFLHVIKALDPKFSVPGSAGFRYRDEFYFLNQYSFPTTQEQFLRDLKAFCPDLPTHTFLPGDVAEITPQGVTIHPQSSDRVEMLENDEYRVEFKPVSEVPRIRPYEITPEEEEPQRETIRDFVENGFLQALSGSKMLDHYQQWNVVYQLEVFGFEDSDIWCIDFGDPQPKIIPGRVGKINLYEGISCSELVRLINKETSWDFVGIAALYRSFHNIYRVNQGQFECFPQDKKFPPPLMEIFPAGPEMDREKFKQDVRRWKAHYA